MPGPALTLSFVLAAIACGFVGLCYAELSTLLPVRASTYTYTYATLGELAAWMIGWDLILEYAMGGAAVAVRLVGLFQQPAGAASACMPAALTAAPGARRAADGSACTAVAQPAGGAVIVMIDRRC